MTADSANLSIDFLAGFTIFILAFIWVASMIPGIMIGLQSNTIDFDAVAYRTGVVLTEDPGWPVSPPWEFYTYDQKNEISRFGLAVTKDTPGILSQNKINRFFSPEFTSDDYHSRVIFGEYPYNYNISILDVEQEQTRSVGRVIPYGYGYIRRLAKIKGQSNATIGTTLIAAHRYQNSENTTQHEFSILINNTRLLGEVRDPAYQIDPLREQIIINITDIRSTITEFPAAVPPIIREESEINLKSIDVYKLDGGKLSRVRTFDTPYIDGRSAVSAPPVLVQDNISLIINPRIFDIMQAGYSSVYFNLTFEVDPPSTFLNNTYGGSRPFEYDYNPVNVTQPHLRDAVVEVAVW